MRLHKLDEPQRFELTEAPRGEFLKPKQLLERFGPLGQRETRRLNDRLLSNFLRNYHQTHDLTPYVTETYRVLAAFPLTKKSFFYPGMCALLQSVDQPEILLEQVFPAVNSKLISKIDHASEVKKISEAQTSSVQEILGNTNTEVMTPFNAAANFQKNDHDLTPLEQVLSPGQEIKFEKPLDLSAILHVEKLPDGHLKLTTISLLYGSYGPTSSGPVLFSLAPPTHLNVEGGLPLLPPKDLISAETQYADYRTKMGFSSQEGTQQTAQPNPSFILQQTSGLCQKIIFKKYSARGKSSACSNSDFKSSIACHSPKRSSCTSSENTSSAACNSSSASSGSCETGRTSSSSNTPFFNNSSRSRSGTSSCCCQSIQSAAAYIVCSCSRNPNGNYRKRPSS